MSKSHPFNFDGGEELSQMGATWFVSYAYFCHIDQKHFNWTKIKTVDLRKSIYETTKQYHKFWLLQILLMEESRLNTNKIEINAIETKKMAKQLLTKMACNISNGNLEVKNSNINTREKGIERMKNLSLVGEKIIKNTGEIFTVLSVDFSNKYIIKLDDGKKGYDLIVAISKKTLRFESDLIQTTVEKILEEIRNGKTTHIKEINPKEDKEERIIKEAVKLFKGNGQKRDMSYLYADDYSILEYGKIYGKKALNIYDLCCVKFNFCISKRENFNIRRILFAPNATPEGYAVWMLPHSNYTGDASSTWANIIEGDTIYEIWNIYDYENNNEKRVTFLKQGNGEYVFMGVYKLEEVRNVNRVIDGALIRRIKVYKRVSTTYQKKKRIVYYN